MQLNINLMLVAADRASELLRAIANRHRLLILCQLIEGERSVGQLADVLGLRDSGVSQHLALLRKDGLVMTRREGQTIWYSIASAEARTLLATLYRIYCMPAAAPTSKRPSKKQSGKPSKRSR
jgi:DNA-binding transcriptional ArsR family regulator